MPNAWAEKRAKEAEFQVNRELNAGGNGVDLEGMMARDTRGAAMGDGDEELFEKKLTKEEKKALAKAKREAKKKAKGSSKKNAPVQEEEEEKKDEMDTQPSFMSKEEKHQALLDDLAKNDIVVTYEAKRGALHANTRDINVGGVTVSFHGKPLIEETELVINYGNRYGFIGPNGSGKVCLEVCISFRSVKATYFVDYKCCCHFLTCFRNPLPAVHNHESHCC